MQPLGERRMLLVHAHPDDETINNGATMARYVAAGVRVTLVTCTRGEQGEVIPRELAHLAADRDDALGPYREGELAAAMAELGVTDHRSLGYRDSGMAFDLRQRIVLPDDARPDAFARADLEQAARRLAAVVVEVRPHVVITYEPGGGYGHPDHVQAHRVTMRAVELASQGPIGSHAHWDVPKLYWVVVPEPSVPDEQVTTVIDGTAFLGQKVAALRRHATQVVVHGSSFALSNGIAHPLSGTEYYQLVRGALGDDRDAHGLEVDLLSGLS